MTKQVVGNHGRGTGMGWIGSSLFIDYTEMSWEQRLAGKVLTNAIENSILTTDPARVPMKKSKEAFRSFIESRNWLLADGYEQGGITRDMCLTMIPIGKHGFIKGLRHLWETLDADVTSTINSAMKSQRATLERQRRAHAGKVRAVGVRGPGNRTGEIIVAAARTNKDTRERLGGMR